MRSRPFLERMGAAAASEAISDSAWWLWCASAAQADDGSWHAYCSRWPRDLPFFEGYLVASEIVHATAATPEGPWTITGPALAERGPHWWDGRMTHNPALIRHGGRWWLYYIGATYRGPRPSAAALTDPDNRSALQAVYASIRIGCAWADTPAGPWHRPEAPCLEHDPSSWDRSLVTNPSPCLAPDGRLLLYYRGNRGDGTNRLGCAIIAEPGAEPVRHPEPVFEPPEGQRVEDPFVWWNGQEFEMIAKDLEGGLCGERHGGIHARSADGLDFQLATPAKSWSRSLRWDDGSQLQMGSLERPWLLFADSGEPSHMLCAMADGPGGFRRASRSWVQIIPLR